MNTDGKVAIELLQYLRTLLDERMEKAKRDNSEKNVWIAGFCADLKAALGKEKSRIYGRM